MDKDKEELAKELSEIMKKSQKSASFARARHKMWRSFNTGAVSIGVFLILAGSMPILSAAVVSSFMVAFFQYAVDETMKVFFPEPGWKIVSIEEAENDDQFKEE